MRVLLIYCHPVEDSYNAALHRAARAALENAGHAVDDCDLYAEGFDPVLSRAERLAWRSGFRRDEDLEAALDAATYAGSRVLGVEGYGLDAGCVADLVLVDAAAPAEAVVVHPPRSLVVKRGVVVGRAADA